MFLSPLLLLSVAFLAGIWLGSLLALPWPLLSGLAVLSLLLGLSERRIRLLPPRRSFPFPYLFLLAALLGGMARCSAHLPALSPTTLPYYNDLGKARIQGLVVSTVEDTGASVQLTLRAESIALADGDDFAPAQPIKGRLLLSLPPGSDVRYGDRLSLTGSPQAPSDLPGFSYRDYLARQGIFTTLRNASVRTLERGRGNPLLAGVYSLRGRAYAFLIRSVPQPEASLLAGILLGIESDMPANLDAAYQSTGTSHVIAISGSNIALVVLLLSALFSRLTSRLWAPVFAIAGIAIYTLLVGAQASVVRAAVMGSIALIGQSIGRGQSGAHALTFTAALMALANPLVLWDAGFQLSFAATLGLVLYASRLQAWTARLLERRLPAPAAQKWARPIGEYLLFSLAAQATTLPIILYHFGRLSLSALIANPLILPAQPLIMSVGGASVLTGLALPPLGRLLAAFAWPLLAYTNRVVELLAQPAWSSAGIAQPGLGFVLGWYALLFGLTLSPGPLGPLKRALSPSSLLPKLRAGSAAWLVSPAALVALALLTGFAWRSALSTPDNRLHLHAFNLPGGPAILLRAPHGASLLTGGARYPQDLTSALGRRLPPLTGRLDALVVSSASSAALQGLPDTVERFPPAQVYWQPGDLPRGVQRLQDTLAAQGSGFALLEPGAVLQLEEGVRLRSARRSRRLNRPAAGVWQLSGADPGGRPGGRADCRIRHPTAQPERRDPLAIRPRRRVRGLGCPVAASGCRAAASRASAAGCVAPTARWGLGLLGHGWGKDVDRDRKIVG